MRSKFMLEYKYYNDELKRNLMNSILKLQIQQYQEQNIILSEDVNNTILNFQVMLLHFC